MERYAVIMAGGGGTRFWPLSRHNMPKQLINLSGNDVMINETIKRLEDVVGIKNILIVTNRNQKAMIREVVPRELPDQNILYEPESRNTAPCIAYAALVIESRCKGAVMCVLPSDHYIADENSYKKILLKAFDTAEQTNKLITIGVKPAFPSTGYGYMRFRYSPDQQEDVYEVNEFIEKPATQKAMEYMKAGNYYWNSGMFVWGVETILTNISRYLPRLYYSMAILKNHIAEGTEKDVIDSVYSNIQNISIDFGILERSDDVLMVSGDFGWSDAGSWDVLGMIYPTDENGNIVKAKHIGMNTRDSIIYSNSRLIATIDLKGLIIADSGDALLICPKNKAQDVKNMVELIKEKGFNEYI